jgi:hypothetical protein
MYRTCASIAQVDATCHACPIGFQKQHPWLGSTASGARARRRAVRRLHPAHGPAKHVSLAARRHAGGADRGGRGGERGARGGDAAARPGQQ